MCQPNSDARWEPFITRYPTDSADPLKAATQAPVFVLLFLLFLFVFSFFSFFFDFFLFLFSVFLRKRRRSQRVGLGYGAHVFSPLFLPVVFGKEFRRSERVGLQNMFRKASLFRVFWGRVPWILLEFSPVTKAFVRVVHFLSSWTLNFLPIPFSSDRKFRPGVSMTL